MVLGGGRQRRKEGRKEGRREGGKRGAGESRCGKNGKGEEGSERRERKGKKGNEGKEGRMERQGIKARGARKGARKGGGKGRTNGWKEDRKGKGWLLNCGLMITKDANKSRNREGRTDGKEGV
jgi:hypothetical protein